MTTSCPSPYLGYSRKTLRCFVYVYLGVASAPRYPLRSMLALGQNSGTPAGSQVSPPFLQRRKISDGTPPLSYPLPLSLTPPVTLYSCIWLLQHRKHPDTRWDPPMHDSAKCCCTVLLTILQHDCRPRRIGNPLSINWRTTAPASWASAFPHLESTTLTHHEETRIVCYTRDRPPAAHTPSVSHQSHLNTALSISRPIGDALKPSHPYEAGGALSFAFSY
jgi:hypothetical protein